MANLFNWLKKDQAKNPSTNQPETTEEDAHGEVQEDIASSDDASQTENLIETAVDNLSTLEIMSADNVDNITVESDSSTIELEQNLQSVDIATIEKPSSSGFFSRLKQSLSRTKESIGTGFVSLFAGKKIDSDLYEQLETQLLIADVGIATTAKIINSLTESAKLSQ